MLKNLRKNEKGFTIIEVLIVLAIAGLIMLIVFLAIPSLQRNQRNNARNGEASRIATAVGECLSNRNGSTSATDGCGLLANVQPGDLQRLESFTLVQASATADAPAQFSTTAAVVRFGRQCNSTGSGSDASTTGSRTFAVLYMLENDIRRCISS